MSLFIPGQRKSQMLMAGAGDLLGPNQRGQPGRILSDLLADGYTVARYEPGQQVGAWNVEQWKDTSGNGHHLAQANAAIRPFMLGGAGTLGPHLFVPYVQGARVEAPVKPEYSITGDIDLRAVGQFQTWIPSGNDRQATARRTAFDNFQLGIGSGGGAIVFYSGTTGVISSSSPGFVDGKCYGFRYTRTAVDGKGYFYRSDDMGKTWDQVGSMVGSTPGALVADTGPLVIGNMSSTGFGCGGNLYSVQGFSTIGGTVPVFDFNASDAPESAANGASWVGRDGATYTQWSAGLYSTQIVRNPQTLIGVRDQCLTTGAFTFPSPVTAYFVGQQFSWGAEARILDGSSPDTVLFGQETASPNVSQYAGNWANESAQWGLAEKAAIAIRWASGAGGIKVNKKTEGSAAAVGSVAPSGISLGSTNVNNAIIQCNELIYRSVYEDAGKRDQIIAALMAKYGIA
jgi:hypothetical protein